MCYQNSCKAYWSRMSSWLMPCFGSMVIHTESGKPTKLINSSNDRQDSTTSIHHFYKDVRRDFRNRGARALDIALQPWLMRREAIRIWDAAILEGAGGYYLETANSHNSFALVDRIRPQRIGASFSARGIVVQILQDSAEAAGTLQEDRFLKFPLTLRRYNCMAGRCSVSSGVVE